LQQKRFKLFLKDFAWKRAKNRVLCRRAAFAQHKKQNVLPAPNTALLRMIYPQQRIHLFRLVKNPLDNGNFFDYSRTNEY